MDPAKLNAILRTMESYHDGDLVSPGKVRRYAREIREALAATPVSRCSEPGCPRNGSLCPDACGTCGWHDPYCSCR